MKIAHGAQVVVGAASTPADMACEHGQGVDEAHVLPAEAVALQPPSQERRHGRGPCVMVRQQRHIRGRHPAPLQKLRPATGEQRPEPIQITARGRHLRRNPLAEQHLFQHGCGQKTVRSGPNLHEMIREALRRVRPRSDGHHGRSLFAQGADHGRRVHGAARQIAAPVDERRRVQDVRNVIGTQAAEVFRAGRYPGLVAQGPMQAGGSQGAEEEVRQRLDHAPVARAAHVQNGAGLGPVLVYFFGAQPQSLVPAYVLPAPVHLEPGGAKPVRAGEASSMHIELGADKAPREGMIRIAAQTQAARAGFGQQGTDIGTIEGAGGDGHVFSWGAVDAPIHVRVRPEHS